MGTVEAQPAAFPCRPAAPDEHLYVTSSLDCRREDSSRSPLLNVYYMIKPLIPRSVQLAIRRSYARRQVARQFPAWPIEPLLVNRQKDGFRAELDARGVERVPFVNFWPDRKRFAFILSHDVEGPAGVENIPRVLEVERRYGMVSSWNFVAEDYPIDPDVFPALRDAGCEIGLHGLTHDGLLFRDRAHFERQLPRIDYYLRLWEAVGFRSPATLRNSDWMPDLGCLYDSSFPDTDPFEPQPGGCCSIWPFFLEDLVELPITMAQDHTLFEILRESSIRVWADKSDWIMRNHGLVNVLVHPDYLIDSDRLGLYEQLLARMAEHPDGWHALPRDVAAWWKVRRALEPDMDIKIDPAVDGGLSARATTAYAYKEGDDIAFDV